MECCGDDSGQGKLPATYNLASRYAGDTWGGINFSFLIDAEPVDFTGCEVEMSFRKSSKIGGVEWLLTTEANQITIEDNKITVLPKKLTLNPGRYVYDLKVTFPGNIERTFVQGSFLVRRNV